MHLFDIMKVICVKCTFPHSFTPSLYIADAYSVATQIPNTMPILADLNLMQYIVTFVHPDLMQLGVIRWQKSHLGGRCNWSCRCSISITLSVLYNKTKCVSVLQGQSRNGTWHKQSCGKPPQVPDRAGGGVYHSTTPSVGWKSGIDTVFHT